MKKKKESNEQIVSTNINEEFPFDQFPWKLVHKDNNETRKCYFQSEAHRTKHITRYNLKNKDYSISYKYENV